jgi:hypothetical protein
MRKVCAVLFATVCTTAAVAQGPRLAVQDWQIYSDAYGTRVDYPADIFSQSGGQSERGFGERFRTPDGHAILEIYSIPNDSVLTPDAFLRNNLQIPRRELEYQRITSSFFAISNARNGVVYYSRCNFSRSPHPLISCIDLSYPAEQERAWDNVVTRISRSLRPLTRGYTLKMLRQGPA